MRFLPLFVFGAVSAVAGSQTFPLSIDEIRVRDPFVYADPDTKL
jgi:hypothetical protein